MAPFPITKIGFSQKMSSSEMARTKHGKREFLVSGRVLFFRCSSLVGRPLFVQLKKKSRPFFHDNQLRQVLFVFFGWGKFCPGFFSEPPFRFANTNPHPVGSVDLPLRWQVKGCMTDCGETDCKWGRPKKQRRKGGKEWGLPNPKVGSSKWEKEWWETSSSKIPSKIWL